MPQRNMEAGVSHTRSIVAAVVIGFATVLVGELPAWIAIGTFVAAFLVAFAVAKRARIYLAVLLFAVPYAIGAVWGDFLGIRFYPWADAAESWHAAQGQLRGIGLAAVIGLALGIADYFGTVYKGAVRWLFFDDDAKRGIRQVTYLGAGVIALHDAAIVAVNLGAVLSQRHALSGSLWLGNGPIGIVITVALSIMLIHIGVGGQRKFALVLFAAMWAPSLVAGARNYFSLVAVAVVFALITSPDVRRRVKWWIFAATAAGVYFFTILPTQWSDNPDVGWNEWILPNSLYLPMVLGLHDPHTFGASPFWEQWQVFLPGPIRLSEVNLLGDTFAALRLTGVGVGGNPWADLYVQDEIWRMIAFAVATNVLILVGAMLGRLSPFAPIVTAGLMAFWGRSLFWTTLFLLVMVSLVGAVLHSFRTTKDRRPVRYVPPTPQHAMRP